METRHSSEHGVRRFVLLSRTQTLRTFKRSQHFDSELIAIAFLFTLTFGSFDTDLLVVLLQRSQILTGLGELAFFHPLPNVPMHEGTLGIHEIELMVDT